jgi:hypothetical protein
MSGARPVIEVPVTGDGTFTSKPHEAIVAACVENASANERTRRNVVFFIIGFALS